MNNSGMTPGLEQIHQDRFEAVLIMYWKTLYLTVVLMMMMTHILTFVVRVPYAEMVGLGFKPQVGHLGIWGLSRGRSQRNCT